MKSFPICWNKVLTQLGFRRKVRKGNSKWQYGRRPLFETLETRQMLAADTYVVNTLLDVVDAEDEFLSLREALTASQTEAGPEIDTIEFDGSLYGGIITLSNQLTIGSNVSIDGLGANALTISGNNAYRVFNTLAGTDVTIKDLKITGGRTTGNNHGAGIYSQGDVTLERVAVIGNQSISSGHGGGLYSGGSVTIIDSFFENNLGNSGGGARLNASSSVQIQVSGTTFANNTAGSGAGLYVWGSVGANTTTVINSTFSGNQADDYAGGLRAQNGGTVIVVNSTITDNHAGIREGGLGAHGASPNNSSIIIHNSIVAGNTDGETSTDSDDSAGGISSASSYNLVGKTTDNDLKDTNDGNIVTTDPKLAPLGYYGGPTKTHALLEGSPAINEASNAKASEFDITLDQRGFERVALGLDEEEILDIGAVEVVDLLFQVDTITDEDDDDYSPGDRSLREVLALAALIPGEQHITFSQAIGSTLTLTLGELTLDSDVEIFGPGYDKFKIDADEQSRIFKVLAGVTVRLQDFEITGGRVTTSSSGGNAGGGIYNAGDLTLDRMVVSDNATDYADNAPLNHGGGIYSVDGSLTVIDTTIDGNRARFGGGIAGEFDGGALEIVRSTLSHNIALDVSDDGAGGALLVSGTASSSLTITNSTFSGNEAGSGGGIRVDGADTELTIINATITDNHADVIGGFGGGIHNADEATITMHNTILAGNTAADTTSPDVLGHVGGTATTPSSHNLLGFQHSSILASSPQHSGLFNGINTNQVGAESSPIDPILAPLGLYGGITKIHPLFVTSPAVDVGSDNLLVSPGQLGLLRAVDLEQLGNTVTNVSDLGAYEAGAPAVVVVTTSEDEDDTTIDFDDMSLREALKLADRLGNAVIRFDTSLHGSTISLSEGELLTHDDELPTGYGHAISIEGPGSNLMTIDAQGLSRVIRIVEKAVSISGITIKNGNADLSEVSPKRGGGIYVASLYGVSLDGVVILENHAELGGAGINIVEGDVSLTNSTVAKNTSTGWGGGIHLTQFNELNVHNSLFEGNSARHGAGIYVGLSTGLMVSNTTISNNVATHSAGGIYVGDTTSGQAVLKNVTITANRVQGSSDGGGVVALNEEDASSQLYIINSIVADNSKNGGSTHSDIAGMIDGASNNLIGTVDSAVSWLTGLNNSVYGSSTQPLDPRLSSLADHGGATFTHALLPDSPAIDAGSNAAAIDAGLSTDQRGYTRIVNYDDLNSTGNNVDIGAYEHGLVVSTLVDEDDNIYTIGDLSLREALKLAGQEGQNVVNVKDEISFAPGLIGGEIALTGELTVDSDVDILGPGAGQLTINAKRNGRAIEVSGSTTDAIIEGLTVTGGSTSGHGAGILNSGANLSLRNMKITDNHTSAGSGGGIHSSNGSLNVVDTIVASNTATGTSAWGGGIYSSGSTLQISGSKILDNKAHTSGGGILVSSGSPVQITDTSISDNESETTVGGGIYFVGTTAAVIRNSKVEKNIAVTRGGGIYSDTGDLSVVDTYIADNKAVSGGGIYSSGNTTITDSELVANVARYGGGIFARVSNNKNFHLEDSTVINNRAEFAGETHSGGIIVSGGSTISGSATILGSTIAHNLSRDTRGDLSGNDNDRAGLHIYRVQSGSVVNSTISNNIADDENGGISLNESGTIEITNSTIAYNEAGVHGGLDVTSSALTVRNTIIGNNIGEDIGTSSAVPTLQNSLIAVKPSAVAINDGGNNLIGNPTLPVDPRLAPLANYGGATKTHALLPGSPAIDKGVNTGNATDQRGLTRPFDYPGISGAGTDIGAFELHGQVFPSGDFDGDGHLDSVHIDGSTDTLYVTLGGSGQQDTQNWAQLDAPQNWFQVHAGDFNGDGRDDLAVHHTGADPWIFLISEGTLFNVHSTTEFPGEYWHYSGVGDFDNDGSDELIGINSDGSTEVLEYDEHSGVSISSWGTPFEDVSPLFVGDVNGDGRDDLILKDSGIAPAYVALSLPSGGFSTEYDFGIWFDNYDDTADYDGSQFDIRGPFDRDPLSIDADGPLRDLTAAFAKVYNNIELELYRGIRKGPEATEQTKSGSAWDQAALLVHTLDPSNPDFDSKLPNYNARIVTGRLTAPIATVAAWLGTTSQSQSVLTKLLEPIDSSPSFVGDNVTFDHAWVRVTIPTTDGMTDVDIDPSWKFKDYQTGIDLSAVDDLNPDDGTKFNNGLFDEIKYLDRTVVQDLSTDLGFRILPDTPLEFFEGELQQWLVESHNGKSVADVPYDGPLKNPVTTKLIRGWESGVSTSNATPQGTYSQILADSNKSEDLTYRFRISLIPSTHTDTATASWSHQSILPVDILSNFHIENVQSGSSGQNVTSTLYANGVAIPGKSFTFNNLPTSTNLELFVEIFEPGEAVPTGVANRQNVLPNSISGENHQRTIGRDRVASIGIDAGQYSFYQENNLARDLIIAVDNGGATVDDFDELLALVNASYLHRFRQSANVAAELTSTQFESHIGLSVISSPRQLITSQVPTFEMEFSPFGILPSDITFDDVRLPIKLRSQSSGNLASEAQEVLSWEMSALQHEVLSANLHAEGVSTVRLMQRSYAGQNLAVVVGPLGNLYLSEVDRDSFLTVIESEEDAAGNVRIVLRGYPRSDFNSGTYSNGTSLEGYDKAAVLYELVAPFALSSINSSNLSTIKTSIKNALYLTGLSGNTITQIPVISAELGEYFAQSLTIDGDVNYAHTKAIVQLPGLIVGGWSGASFIGSKGGGAEFDHWLDRMDADEQFTSVSGRGSGGTGTFYPSALYAQNVTFVGAVGASQVNPVDGSVRQSVNDIRFPTLGAPLNFTRNYNSRSTRDIGLGVGWSHSFSDRLLAGEGNDLIWLTSEGLEHRFDWNGSGYTVPNELLGTFVNDSGIYKFKARDGKEIHFQTTGQAGTTDRAPFARLAMKLDLNGNGIKVNYDSITGGNYDLIGSITSWTGGVGGTANTSLRLEVDYSTAFMVDKIRKYAPDISGTIPTWDFNHDTTIESKRYLDKVTYPTPQGLATGSVNFQYQYYGTSDPTSFKGLLKTITEPNGNPTSYEYYPNKRLFTATTGIGEEESQTTYSYDPVQGRTFVRDSQGNEEIYSFNENGLVTRQIHADRTRVETKWGVPNTNGNTNDPKNIVSGTEFLKTQESNEVGAIQTFEYHSSGFDNRALEQSTSWHFLDLEGNVIGQPGLVVEYDYEQGDSESGKDHMVNLKTVTRNPGPNSQVTTFSYDDQFGRLESADSEGQTTLYYYNSLGLLESKIDPRGTNPDSGSDNEAVTWQPIENVFELEGTSLTVVLQADNSANGAYVADAMRIDMLNAQGAVERTLIIDDGNIAAAFNAPEGTPFRLLGSQANFSNTSSSNLVRYFGDSIAFGGASSNKAVWTFTGLEAGTYRISTLWDGYATRNSGAIYRVYDGSLAETPLVVPPVPQNILPVGFNAFETTYDNYNSAGLVTSMLVAGLSTGISTYHHTGQRQRTTDGTGRITENSYDVLGRLRSSALLGNSSSVAKIEATYFYDESGNLKTATDALGRVTAYDYDSRGLLVSKSNPDGTEQLYTFDTDDNLVAQTDELGNVTRFIYDSRDRLIKTIHPDGAIDSIRYDGVGRVSETTDALGRTTSYSYDADGKITSQHTKVTVNIDEDEVLKDVITTYKYDVYGNLVETIDPEGQVTQLKYDEHNRVIQTMVLNNGQTNLDTPQEVAAARANLGTTALTSPPIQLSTAAYDANGYIASVTVFDVSQSSLQSVIVGAINGNTLASLASSNADNIQNTFYEYDSFNRLTKTTYADATSAELAYDGAGRVRLSLDELNRPTASIYDAYGRLKEQVLSDPNSLEAEGPKTTFEYDAVGNVVSVTDANGHKTTNSYDERNRLIATTNAEHETTQTFYDAAGQVIATTDALGRAYYTRRDERGRVILQRLPDADPESTGLSRAAETKYCYDAVGNIISVTDSRGFVTKFAYDELNRLIEESSPISEVLDNSKEQGPDPQLSMGGNPAPQFHESADSFGGDYTDITQSTAGSRATATWTFMTLAAGTYRVGITWQAASTLDTNASLLIRQDGVNYVPYLSSIDQTKSPNEAQKHFYREYEGKWVAWAEGNVLVVAEGQTIDIRLRSGTVATSTIPTATIRADAVTLERIDVTRTYDYDLNGNLVSETDSLGRETTYNYDELNRLTETQLPDPDGDSGELEALITGYKYDGYGNLIETSESMQTSDRITRYTYDERNRVETMILNAGGTLSVQTSYDYDDVGNLTKIEEVSETAYNERTTIFGYDNLNRLVSEYSFTGDQSSRWQNKSSYTYDPVGNLESQTTYVKRAGMDIEDASSTTTAYVYDDANRLLKEIQAFGTALEATTSYSYDATGNLLSFTDASGRKTSYEYDRLGQMTKIVEPDPDGSGIESSPSTLFTYDVAGNLLSQENAESEERKYIYDSLGRQIVAIQSDKSELRYTYDSESNLVMFIDGEYKTTRYEYDDLNRTNEVTDPEGLVTTYDYDNSQNLVKITDRLDRVTRFVYDRLDRLEEEHWYASDGETITDTLSWEYDKLNRVRKSKHVDNTASQVLYAESFTYDSYSGNLGDYITIHDNFESTEIDSVNPRARQVSYLEFTDLADNELFRTVVVQQTGNTTTTPSLQALAETSYTTDFRGNLSAIDDMARSSSDVSTKSIDLTYDRAGRVITINRSQPGSFNFNSVYQYDGNGRISDIDHYRLAELSPFSSFDYSYDEASRIINIDSATSFSALKLFRQQTFEYNTPNPGQLTGYTSNTVDLNNSLGSPNLNRTLNHSYPYDANGNRELPGSTIDDANRILDDTENTYTYDAEGNRTTRRDDDNDLRENYVWDHRNRLIEVTTYDEEGIEESHVKYTYNNSDLVVRKEVFENSVSIRKEHYVYDGDQLSMVLDDSGELEHRYLYGPGTDSLLVDEVFDGESATSLWAATDHLGSVHDYLQGTGSPSVVGALVRHLEYDAYGEINRVLTPAEGTADWSDIDDLFAFAGRTWDQDAKLYYNRARWYDPATSRFLSEDPIGMAGGDPNLYRYAGNDPVNYRDPSGLFEDSYAWYWPSFDFGADLGGWFDFDFGQIFYDVGNSFASAFNFGYDAIGQIGANLNYFAANFAGSFNQISFDPNSDASFQAFKDSLPDDPNEFHRILDSLPPATRRAFDQRIRGDISQGTVQYDSVLGTGMHAFFVDTLYGGAKALVTGEAGRALGERGVGIVETQTGRNFTGSTSDYARFGRGIAGDMIGVNGVVEAGYGYDISNEQRLEWDERIQRGASGVGQLASGAVGLLKARGVPSVPKPSSHPTYAPGNLGKLRYIGQDTWETSSGLRYGPDLNPTNPFGNRVQHVLHHAKDVPTRPGKHGVFDVGPEGALEIVDEAWVRIQSGSPGVTSKTVTTSWGTTRTTYVVPMGRRVGYVGGAGGAKIGNPAATSIQIIVESGNNVISAYPVTP